MKRKTLLFFIKIIIAITPIKANAQPTQTMPIITIEQDSDGNYYEIVTTSWDETNLLRTSMQKSASKTINYKNSSGEVLWYVKVTGTFTYEKGISSHCTKSVVSANSNNALWKISNKTCSKSGNTANASAKGTLYRGTTAIRSLTKSVSISCDKFGNIS